MPQTEFWGMPYPALNEAPNGPAQIEALARTNDSTHSAHPLCALTTNQVLGQTVFNDAASILTMDVVVQNAEGMYNAETSKNSIFIVKPGAYDLRGSCTFAANTAGSRFVNFLITRQSGAAAHARVEVGANPAAGRGTTVTTFDTLRLAAGDRIQLQAWQNSGGNLLTSAAAPTLSRLSARFVHA